MDTRRSMPDCEGGPRALPERPDDRGDLHEVWPRAGDHGDGEMFHLLIPLDIRGQGWILPHLDIQLVPGADLVVRFGGRLERGFRFPTLQGSEIVVNRLYQGKVKVPT